MRAASAVDDGGAGSLAGWLLGLGGRKMAFEGRSGFLGLRNGRLIYQPAALWIVRGQPHSAKQERRNVAVKCAEGGRDHFGFGGFWSRSAWRLAISRSIAGVIDFDFGAWFGDKAVRRKIFLRELAISKPRT